MMQKGETIMDFITIAKKRCSVRSYTDQKVEPEKLEKILAIGYAGEKSASPERHSQARIPMSELVSYESL